MEFSAISLGRFATLPLLAIGLVFFGYRLYQKGLSYTMIYRLCLGTALLMISAISALPKPVPFWLHTLGTAAMHYSALYIYVGLDQLLNNKPYRLLIKDRVFLLTTSISVVIAIIDYLRRDALIPIIDNEPYERTWTFFTAESLHYALVSYLVILIVRLYWKNIRKHREPTYLARRCITMLAFVVAATASIAAAANVVLALFFGEAVRAQLNMVYHVAKPIFFSLLVVGLVLPQTLYRKALAPLERSLERRRRRDDELLRYVHLACTAIAPPAYQITLPENDAARMRILVEISDAREIIWSQASHDGPITPEAEADVLYQLFTRGIVLREPGKHLPPPLAHHDVIAHNLSVAKLLQRRVSDC